MRRKYNTPHNHPYGTPGYWQEVIEEMQDMRKDLDDGNLTPRQVIGGGYKGNTRKIAEQWIDQRIAEAQQELAS